MIVVGLVEEAVAAYAGCRACRIVARK